MQRLLICVIAVAGMLFGACCDDDPVPPAAVTCEGDLLTGIPNNPVVAGAAAITRTDDAINLTLDVDGLIPGHAYTVWWVVWNYPEFCDGACDDPDIASPDVKPEIIYATGNVVGSTKANFGATLHENDPTGSINQEFFMLPSYGGLQDARNAEIHVVLRSHGPAIPGHEDEQTSTYAGGCNPADPNYNGGMDLFHFLQLFRNRRESAAVCLQRCFRPTVSSTGLQNYK